MRGSDAAEGHTLAYDASHQVSRYQYVRFQECQAQGPISRPRMLWLTADTL
jgi:hypothetical protein